MVKLLSIVFLSAFYLTLVHAETQLLWGDTHVHTSYSPDSYMTQNFSIDPNAAYRFAKGLPVIHPSTRTRVKIETPLDFLVVADHAESFGVFKCANEQGLPRYYLGPLVRLHSCLAEKALRYLVDNPASISIILNYATAKTNDVVESAKTPPNLPIPNRDLIVQDSWVYTTTAADAHNEPGKFSAIIGWEWSSIPAGANLHRVVFTNSDASVAQQYQPYSSSISIYPEDLWRWLYKTASATGADFISSTT